VVDLGCWPGGWLELAARVVGPRGRVVGVDLAAIEPPLRGANVFAIQGDLGDPAVRGRILAELGGTAAVVLCDAAPKLTGVRDVDRAAEERLLEAIAEVLPGLLRAGGDLVLKILEGPEAQAVEGRIRARFARAKVVRPEATRRGSSERYLLARGYRPPAAPAAPSPTEEQE
jgi:23S rRNA (uridine2552-2'-O)-methyltransferase